MSAPQERTVRVRRSPKVGVFLGLGAALGAVAALAAVALAPADPQVPLPQALGFLVLLLAPVGALVGGGVALVLEAAGERRARTVQAEWTGTAVPAEEAAAPDAAGTPSAPDADGSDPVQAPPIDR